MSGYRSFAVMTLCVCLCFVFVGTVRADEETLGRRAEQEGNLHQALNHYITALQSIPKGGYMETEFREKIIKLAQKIEPMPEIPEQAGEHLARGRDSMRDAQDQAGFLLAAREFEEALLLAPWLAEGYYNLGIVLDKAGRYGKAGWALRLYLCAAPEAGNALQVVDRLYEIEHRLAEAQRRAARE